MNNNDALRKLAEAAIPIPIGNMATRQQISERMVKASKAWLEFNAAATPTKIIELLDEIDALSATLSAEPEPQEIHSCSYYCDRPECIKSRLDAQAQAGEPDVVAYAGNNGELFPTTHGYDVLRVGDELITLQSHREAMALRHSMEVDRYDANNTMWWEEVAKKDAELLACVEALGFYGRCLLRLNLTGELMVLTPIKHDCGDRARAASTKAKEALK